MIADKIGYGKLVIAAFLFHIAVGRRDLRGRRQGQAQATAYLFLYLGTFLFASPTARWRRWPTRSSRRCSRTTARTTSTSCTPAGRPAWCSAALVGWVLDDSMQLGWKMQLGLFLVPTVVYGVMFLGQRMPKSEASEKGLSLGEMFKDVGILGGAGRCFLIGAVLPGSAGADLSFFTRRQSTRPRPGAYSAGRSAGCCCIVVGVITKFSIGSFLLFVLFIAHALVGAVELGTDGWIQNITGNILTSERGQDPVRLHVAGHVRAAVLCRLHREEARPVARSASC